MHSIQSAASNTSHSETIVFMSRGPSLGPVESKEFPLKFFHSMFGIVQMVIGGLMFVLKVTALCAVVPFSTDGSGIYCGVFVFVIGLLSLRGAKLSNRPLMIVCMILNAFAIVAWSVGLRFSSFEVKMAFEVAYSNPTAPARYGYGESFLMFLFCFSEFILTVFHTSLSCMSFWFLHVTSEGGRQVIPAVSSLCAQSHKDFQSAEEDIYTSKEEILMAPIGSVCPLQPHDEDFQFNEQHFAD